MSCAIIFLIIFLLNTTNATEFTSTTTSTNTTTQQINQIINTEPKYVDAIIEKLHIENANKCIYGKDPKLIDLCPEYFPNKPTKHNELTFQKIVNLIINKTIIQNLKQKCLRNEWCLEESQPFAAKMIHEHSFELCLFSACFNSHSFMTTYINKCIDSDVSKSVLNIVPILCELNNNIVSKDFCLESSMRLIHSTIASDYSNLNRSKLNNCEEYIRKDKCTTECKSIASELNRLKSCCHNSSLVERFSSFNWYADYLHQVQKSCSLPVTGICYWSEKYIGFSPNAIIIAVSITVLSMIILFVTINLLCCAKNLKIQQPFTDSYEYSQLNQEVEEEMNMVKTNYSEDEYGNILRSNRIDLDQNTNISRFVNQHQTDIKSLLLN